ncbi:hypothetical protein L873DRAFT_1800050 [Choiromyces venosus 120613-1]|uniref:Uncharacterized protein n=1 Tax=Choiromyces venosus 120613-1 TaxID=1336337 RepID=A0A3N4K3F2_9PEZI|nr:hypothetical protein L873DRAFT_1800050 [Choiromyces venosus 120613-1]
MPNKPPGWRDPRPPPLPIPGPRQPTQPQTIPQKTPGSLLMDLFRTLLEKMHILHRLPGLQAPEPAQIIYDAPSYSYGPESDSESDMESDEIAWAEYVGDDDAVRKWIGRRKVGEE